MTHRAVSPRHRIRRYTHFIMLQAILVIGLLAIFNNGSVSATISKYGPQLNSSNSVGGLGTQPWFAVGVGQYDGKTSYAKLYVPVGQSATLTIVRGGGICSGTDVGSPDVDYYIDNIIDAPEVPPVADESFGGPFQATNSRTDTSIPPAGTGCRDIVINIPANSTGSSVKGHQGYHVWGFLAWIINAPGDNEKSFRLEISNGYVGVSRPIRSLDIKNVFGVYRRDIANDSQNWNYQVEAADYCAANPAYTQKQVLIYDADYGVYNPQSLAFTIEEADKGASNWNQINKWTNAQLGVNGEAKLLTFNSNPVKKYRFTWSGIHWRNTLQIRLPFDQFDSILPSTDCGSPPVVTCNFATAGINPALINQASPFTVNISNNGGSALDSSYSLRQTYRSSFDQTVRILSRSLTGGSVGSVPYSGPGYLGPGQSGNFSFDISRAAPGTFYFDFRMQQNGNLTGANCHLELIVSPTLRPACNYLDGTSFSLPYGGGPISFRVGILNNSGQNWTNRYFMVEDINGGGYNTNIHYLGDPNANPNAAAVGNGAYTDSIRRTFNVTSTTNFNYQVWVQPPPPVYATYKAFRLANPEPTNNLPPWTKGQAPGSATCTITVYVDNPPVYTPAGSFTASCTSIQGNISYQGTGGAPVGLLRIIRNSDGASMGDVGVGAIDAFGPSTFFNKDPFRSWRLAPHYTYRVELHGQNSAGEWQPVLYTAQLNGGNPCVQVQSCSISSTDVAPEPGQSTTARISMTAANYTSVSFDPSYGYTVFYNSAGSSVIPPSGNTAVTIGVGNPVNVPDPPITVTIIPTSIITINAGMRYLGTPLPGVGDCGISINPATKPFFQVKSGDIKAGGGFESDQGVCPSTSLAGYISPRTTGNNYSGGIRAFGDPSSGSNPGSTVDFGAYALGLIASNPSAKIGFKSLVSTNALFANMNIPAGGLGGYLNSNSQAHCVQDFFTTTRIDPNPGNFLGDLNSSVSGQYLASNSINLNASTISARKQITLYVDGDVTINGDITYADRWNPNDQASVPYFALIVRGNIIVNSNVTRLDGLYVAQPIAGGTKGSFKTCNSPCIQPAIGGNRQLVINGQVIAQRVELLRPYGTLGPLATDPSNITTNPAEIINFIPSMIIGSPQLAPIKSGLQGIFSLPPVF